jgi:hypothetical protein
VADGIRPGPHAFPAGEGVMQTVQDQLALLLRSNRTIYFCDGCLVLKMGAFPREVRDALAVIGRGDRFQLVTGQCSECLPAGPVIRALSGALD